MAREIDVARRPVNCTGLSKRSNSSIALAASVVFDQETPLIRVLQQRQHAIADQVGCRFLAHRQQQRTEFRSSAA
jgi:hypothetical protein